MGRKSNIDWGSADWGKRDVDLAQEFGCSRERVRQVRKAFGEGRSPMWHKRTGTAAERIVGLETKGMTPEEVAKVAGCSEAYAKGVMESVGKGWVVPPDGRCVWKYQWGSITPVMWQKMTDKEVAKKLGVGNAMVVTQWRRRKGIMKRVGVVEEVS